MHLAARRRRLEVLPRVGVRVRRQRKRMPRICCIGSRAGYRAVLCMWRMHRLPRDLLPCPGA